MRFLIPIFLITVISCQSCVSPSSKPDQDTHAVIAACILDVVGSADSAQYYYKVIAPSIEDRLPEMKKYNDSVRYLLDTAKIYFCINKTLGGIYRDDQEYLNNILKNEQALDTLQTSIQTIDTAYLSGILGIRARTTAELINDEIRLIGFFTFSKVIFNNAKNRAWAALNFHVGKTGYCDYFFLDKKEGKWMLTKRDRTWVS